MVKNLVSRRTLEVRDEEEAPLAIVRCIILKPESQHEDLQGQENTNTHSEVTRKKEQM